MISPLRNGKLPFERPSDIVYFHDWRYVQHGNVGWCAEEGSRPPMRYESRFLPLGIRLVALEAATEGQFALQPIKTARRRMRLNFRTPLAGCVRVELLDGKNRPLPGRAFADCDWLCGDELDREVTWKGDPDLGHTAETPITLCFQLRCARLFSVAFA